MIQATDHALQIEDYPSGLVYESMIQDISAEASGS